MEQLGSEVQRELARFGPLGAMAALVDAWPAAVGVDIARNAWPARVGRDGTLHVHTADSIWAFELSQRSVQIADRLGVPAVRFAAGPLPERTQESSRTRAESAIEPSARDLEQAAALAAGIDDLDLRERIAQAAALSLARAASGRPF